MYTLRPTSLFKKDLKRSKRRGLNIDKLMQVLNTLASGDTLPPSYRDHELSGTYKGCRECHIEPDWLLIYEIDNDNLFLYLLRTGTHSDLF